MGTVVAHGQGVTEPAIGSRVGIKWLADVCNVCRKYFFSISSASFHKMNNIALTTLVTKSGLPGER